MILRFGAANHKSLKTSQELSLIATGLKDRALSLVPSVTSSGLSVLSAAILYGANASGKSNVVTALSFVRSAVLHSHPKGEPDALVPRISFALDPAYQSLPSAFDVDFVVDDTRYHFGFEADDNHFLQEWLYSFPLGRRQMLYERTGPKEIRFGRSLKGRNRIMSELMRENSLFLSVALQNGHPQLTQVANFFRDIVISSNIEIVGPAVSSRFKKNDIDERTIDFLKKMRTGVVGFRRVESERSPEQIAFMKDFYAVIIKGSEDSKLDIDFNENDVNIELAHEGLDGNEVYFDAEMESSGTRRLLVLLSSAFRALDKGDLLVVDELDASLHTQVCEALIGLFANKKTNPRGAQLIATTHDTNLMRSPWVRRDQVWFAEKDNFGATHLFPLSDIRTRNTDNIEKGYLEGRFGAIPFSGSISELFEGV